MLITPVEHPSDFLVECIKENQALDGVVASTDELMELSQQRHGYSSSSSWVGDTIYRKQYGDQAV